MITVNQIKIEMNFEKLGRNLTGCLQIKDMIDDKEVLKKKVAKVLGVKVNDIEELHIMKHSIDARKKPQLFQVYTVNVALRNKNEETKVVKKCKNTNVLLSEIKNYKFPDVKEGALKDRPVVVGMGPAGLFCAYMLAKSGCKPIVLERGYDVETRTKDVERYWNEGILNTESNVQFGEGGAGTFSDGKLNTLIKDKTGRNREVLRIFVECGAPEEILYESKPHIGTDVLKKVVINMRNCMIDNGAEVMFGSKMTALEIENGQVCGVIVNDKEVIKTSKVVLAIGHSARDTFKYLASKNIDMEAKSFAVGMRVEHPQRIINEALYGPEHGDILPAAPYKLTARTSTGRGVYSFCMCPGGYVVNASSEEGRIAVNGMSYSDRASHNANSAIIVQVTPKDFDSEDALAGVEFQRRLEEKAYKLGQGKVPVQYYGDYKVNKQSYEDENANKPCIKGEYLYTNLRGLLPDECEKAFIEGMEQFDKIIKGYSDDRAILSGIESRTSSPVRIHRDESMQSPSIRGLYPCGEGAGYAGGITSAAMDGILVAENIVK